MKKSGHNDIYPCRGSGPRRLLVSVLADGFYRSGLFARWLKRESGVLVVLHHRVQDEPDPLHLSVTPEVFEKQVDFLASNFKIIPLQEGMARERGASSLRCALTIDDGYADNYTAAWPILRRRNLPVTIFLTTGGIGKDIFLWYDKVFYSIWNASVGLLDLRDMGLGTYNLRNESERGTAVWSIVSHLKELDDGRKNRLVDVVSRLPAVAKESVRLPAWSMLTEDQIREMKDSGTVRFGAHTVNHPILANLSPESARDEIVASRLTVAQWTEQQVNAFSYPNGSVRDFRDCDVKAVCDAGYTMAVTTIPGLWRPDGDPFRIPRVSVNSAVSDPGTGGGFSPAVFAFYLWRKCRRSRRWAAAE